MAEEPLNLVVRERIEKTGTVSFLQVKNIDGSAQNAEMTEEPLNLVVRERIEKTGTVVRGHEQEIRCEYCKSLRNFLNKQYLKIHIRSRHPEKAIICAVCDTSFLSLMELRNHKTMHRVNRWKIHTCNICKYRTFRKACLRSHVVNKHSRKSEFNFHEFERLFRRQGDLMKHLHEAH